MTPEVMPTQIGRYQIVAEIGRGGFGRVYKAFDPKVGRSVAIKILTEATPDIVSRFRNEATVAGNLRHENIVTVYEFGEHDGLPFLVMEYLEGEDLQRIIQSQRPLTLLQKCNIVSQVAEGFYCAHRNGVVHRDVKPANIMVLPDGTVKIKDFDMLDLRKITMRLVLRSKARWWVLSFTWLRSSFRGMKLTPCAISSHAAPSTTSCLPASIRLRRRTRALSCTR